MGKLARLEKLLMAVTACGFVLFAVTGWWLRDSEVEPEMNIPQRVVPRPNAVDYYVNAALLTVPAPRRTPIDPALDYSGRSRKITDPRELQRRYPLAAKVVWLQQNRPALAVLRQGFAYPAQYPRETTSSPYSNALPSGNLFELARLLVVESHVYQERGDWKGASRSALDVLQLGSDLPRGAPLTARWEGQIFQALGRRELWQCLPHLDRGAAKIEMARLRRICASQVPFSDTMREEKYRAQRDLMSIFHSFNWRYGVSARASGAMSGSPDVLTLPEKLQLQIISKRTLMRDLTAVFDESIREAQLPYRIATSPFPAADPYCRRIIVDYGANPHEEAALNSTLNDLLLVSLALRVYALEHNNYPAQLSALVPGYLKTIPMDSFGSSVPLRYRRTGQSYTLWSVGPDGRDDGGKPIANRLSSYYRMPLSGKGDIVAGINRW